MGVPTPSSSAGSDVAASGDATGAVGSGDWAAAVAGAGLAPMGGSVGPSTVPLSKSEPARTIAVVTAMAVAVMNTLLVPLAVTWTGRSWPIRPLW